MSVLHQREKKYASALRTLRELERAFPRNPLFTLERGSVLLLRKEYRESRNAFREVRAKRDAGLPNFEVVEPSLIRLRIGEMPVHHAAAHNGIGEAQDALPVDPMLDPTAGVDV